MSRISKEAWAMELAWATAKRSTCLRRHVGAVLLDVDWHVLATGVNGVAQGQPHCNQVTALLPTIGVNGPIPGSKGNHEYGHACPGARAASGTNLDGCYAIHAEQNALLQCPDVRKIHVAVVTASPCMTCTKLLLNTGCKVIIFDEEYPHATAKDLWTHSGRLWLPIQGIVNDANCQ